jgi:hypothetical protein
MEPDLAASVAYRTTPQPGKPVTSALVSMPRTRPVDVAGQTEVDVLDTEQRVRARARGHGTKT